MGPLLSNPVPTTLPMLLENLGNTLNLVAENLYSLNEGSNEFLFKGILPQLEKYSESQNTELLEDLEKNSSRMDAAITDILNYCQKCKQTFSQLTSTIESQLKLGIDAQQEVVLLSLYYLTVPNALVKKMLYGLIL